MYSHVTKSMLLVENAVVRALKLFGPQGSLRHKTKKKLCYLDLHHKVIKIVHFQHRPASFIIGRSSNQVAASVLEINLRSQRASELLVFRPT